MVCLGNICRSPLAEGILKSKVEKEGLDWEVESAGTNGLHNGERPHKFSQKVARHNGLDISCQTSRLFKKEDFRYFDKIYAMAKDVVEEMRGIAQEKFDASKVELLMNVMHPGQEEDVPDPWYGGEEGYHRVYGLIDQACDRIVQAALQSQKHNPSTPSNNKI